MPDPSSLYPQAQPPGGILGGNPLQLVGALNQINALKAFQAKQAVGNALLNSRNPDGSIDTNAFVTGLPPEAALAAPEAAGAALDLRGKQIANDTAQFGLGVNYNAAAQNILSGLAGKDAISDADLWDASARLARTGMPAPLVNAWRQTMLGQSADQRKQYATTLGITAAGPSAVVGREPVVSPSGQPASVPVGVAARQPILPTGLSPAQTAAQSTSGAATAAQGVDLGKAADSSPIRKAMLGNLEADMQQFTSGPGADWTKVAKAWANRNILPTPLQFDPTSIASQEAFTKQAEQLAQQQFQAIGGTGTDAKFGSAFKSNPNDTLSQLGNKGIIRLLKGNEDALQAKNKAWQSWLANGDPDQPTAPHGPDTYQTFTAKFNQTFDPRVYQSQYMSKDDFVKMIKAMSATEQAQFKQRLGFAAQNGFSGAPGSSYNGQ